MFGLSGGREGELGRFRSANAVRTSRAAGFGASAERFIDDGFDGASTTATFGAATEATINLLGIARQILRGAHSAADIVVGEDVAGTDDHENNQRRWLFLIDRYANPAEDAKGKTAFSSDSKLAELILTQTGMNLKRPVVAA